jgi:Phage tail tube protein
MASIQTRSSVLAIVEETTEGTLKEATGATSFIALQDDFSMSPNTNLLENNELKASIGKAKSILGAEAPSASFSHYIRHSGVEGTAPNYGLLLEAALGDSSTASTQYDTVASSTTTVIKVDTGEGATFERGEALLIKDATNGYRIRCIDSISSNDLTIGFQVPNAPASGVNLGKCSLFKPTNSAHPTLSLWHYVGNSGAIQAMSGARVTSTSIDISAGELINANYSLEGTQFYFDPIEVGASANALVIDIGGGDVSVTVTAGWYKTPHELAAAILTAIQASLAGTYTFTYSDSTGKFTTTKSTGSYGIKWLTGTNSIGATLGFTANDTGALTYTSDAAQDYAAPYTPSYDSSDPLAAKDNEAMLGDSDDYVCFKASTVNVSIDTPKADISSVCAVSGIQGSIISEREVTITVSALIEQYDASKFEKYRTNEDTKFQYTFGTKSGGNWVAGKCGAIYVPTCTISSFALSDADGLVQMDLELKAFVNSSGQGEVYIGFV